MATETLETPVTTTAQPKTTTGEPAFGLYSARSKSEASKIAAIAQLGRIPATKLPMFLHLVIDDVCGKDVSYQTVAPNYEQIRLLVEGCKLFLKNAISHDTKKEDLLADLTKLNLSEAHRTAMVDGLIARWFEIRTALARDTAKISSLYLKDFDWKLQLTLASDKLATLREPSLLLNLTLDDGNAPKQVLAELPRADLDALLATLAEVNDAMLKLKV